MQESNAGNLESTVQTIEAQTILETLKKNNYNKIKTAQDLGMHKSTLYRKMKKYEISLARPSNEQTKS
jgi:transcriptional regulator with PAS, ATPase and Fis domain